MNSILGLLFAIATAMIGNHMHGSWFWTIVDFFLSPLVWVKWLICHEITFKIIGETFAFLSQ